MSGTAPILRRVRHELRLRRLQVKRVHDLTPRMRRVTLTGPELSGFVSASHDDHVKLFFPPPGADEPVLPSLGPDGPVFPEGAPRPVARDYTPRRYDPDANELDIDFALHEAGPATAWARKAKPGLTLGVGGPRGSFVVTRDFDGYLLVGDESALPAIGRRLEELPAGARVQVVVEVADAAEEQTFESRAHVSVTWVHRGSAEPGTGTQLLGAVRAQKLPPGETYAWVACESGVAKALRQHLVGERGLPKERVKAAGYWKRGAVAIHERHEED